MKKITVHSTLQELTNFIYPIVYSSINPPITKEQWNESIQTFIQSTNKEQQKFIHKCWTKKQKCPDKFKRTWNLLLDYVIIHKKTLRSYLYNYKTTPDYDVIWKLYLRTYFFENFHPKGDFNPKSVQNFLNKQNEVCNKQINILHQCFTKHNDNINQWIRVNTAVGKNTLPCAKEEHHAVQCVLKHLPETSKLLKKK